MHTNISILLALFVTASANAQPSATSPETTSPSIEVEKFQIINKDEANQRCSSDALVKCLKITKEACETASNAAAEAANAEIDSATGGKELSAFDAGFYQGQAMATFMMEMQKRTDNRFIKCLQKN